MTASLSKFLAPNDSCSVRQGPKENSKPAAVLPLSQRPRDERPMQPRRSRSNKMANARGHASAPELRRKNPAPLAARFSRLHSDNFLYCSDLVHVRENSKKGLSQPSRQESIRNFDATDDDQEQDAFFTDDDTIISFDVSIDETDPFEEDDDADDEAPNQEEDKPMPAQVPQRPCWKDRWNAAFANGGVGGISEETSSQTRGRSNARRRSRSRRRRQGSPRLARRHESASRGRRRESLQSTTSTFTTLSSISGKSDSMIKFAFVDSPLVEASDEGSTCSSETSDSSPECPRRVTSPERKPPRRSSADIVLNRQERPRLDVPNSLNALRDSFLVRNNANLQQPARLAASLHHTRSFNVRDYSRRRMSDEEEPATLSQMDSSLSQMDSSLPRSWAPSPVKEEEEEDNDLTLSRVASSRPWGRTPTRKLSGESYPPRNRFHFGRRRGKRHQP